MEKSLNNSITHLYDELKSRVEVQALIPMGYVPGMPIIAILNDQLVAKVPFLRYKATGEIDRTLVFPIKYMLEYLVPEGQVVGFKDLSIDPNYVDCNFEKVIGFFRHESVKHMDKNSFLAFKRDTLSLYDKLVSYLIDENDSYCQDEDKSLASNLQTIIEPFVIKQYALLDNDFYNKYLKN